MGNFQLLIPTYSAFYYIKIAVTKLKPLLLLVFNKITT